MGFQLVYIGKYQFSHWLETTLLFVVSNLLTVAFLIAVSISNVESPPKAATPSKVFPNVS